LELVNVATNKNTVPGDKSALVPGGLRIGTPAMTSRGFKEAEFNRVVNVIDEAVKIAQAIASSTKGTKFSDFKSTLGDGSAFPEIISLKKQVQAWTKQYPVVGFDTDSMRYKD
jgi:glycine hydroxymethyltransferase